MKNPLKFISAFIIISLFSITNLFPQTDLQKVLSTVHLNDVKGHLTFIASDELKGRNTGSEGLKIAAQYIKSQLMSHGVTPAPGMKDYFQEVPLSVNTPPKKGTITKDGHTLDYPDDIAILGGKNNMGKFSFINVGYSRESDLSDVDLSNKIAISICGDGKSENPQSWFYQAHDKIKRLEKAGAIGLIELYQSNRVPFKFLKQQFARTQMSLDSEKRGEFLHIWMNAANKDKIGTLSGEGELELYIEIPDNKVAKSQNVVGFVEGSDPGLKNEYIVYSAHYDHVGIGNADASGDSIYNGARDNAVGTTAILEVAENLAKYPTKRSALFVFFTAEEKGLLGSKYFVENCPVDLKDIVYNFNIDNGGYNDTTIISVVGLDRTTAGDHIQKSCNTFDLTAIEDPAKEQGLFDRSDNVNFAKKGIPAPTFSLGFRSFDAEIFKYYHQPGDEVESLDFNYLLKYFRAYVLSARKIANADEKPFWIEGDKYYDAGVELYGQ